MQFEAHANAKYCSEKCREIGNKKARDAWEKRVKYNDSQRAKRVIDREKNRVKMVEIANQRQAELKELQDKRLKADYTELKRKAESGDYYSKMRLAEINHNKLEYWRNFALYEIKESEDYGRKSTRTVNDISVYDKDFAKLVVESIVTLGHCISKTQGIGEKI